MLGLSPEAGALGGLAVLVAKSFSFVQEGERGLLLRWGKVVRKGGEPNVIEPGFKLMLPFIDKLRRRHVRQQTLAFHEQMMTLKNGLSYRVSAVVFFRVKDIYKALFEISDLDDAVQNVAMGILRDIITAFEDHHGLSDMKGINESLLSSIKKHADEWGVDFLEFRLTDCVPTEEAALTVAAEAGAVARAQAAKKALEALQIPVASADPALVAALVGIPMVASLGSRIPSNNELPQPKKKEKEGAEGILSRF